MGAGLAVGRRLRGGPAALGGATSSRHRGLLGGVLLAAADAPRAAATPGAWRPGGPGYPRSCSGTHPRSPSPSADARPDRPTKSAVRVAFGPGCPAPPVWPEPVARHTMPLASRAHDDGAAEACLEGTSSSRRRRLPGADRQRAPQQGSGQPEGAIRRRGRHSVRRLRNGPLQRHPSTNPPGREDKRRGGGATRRRRQTPSWNEGDLRPGYPKAIRLLRVTHLAHRGGADLRPRALPARRMRVHAELG